MKYIAVSEELNFDEIAERVWGGAEDTIKTIREHNLEEEFMALLEELFFEETPTFGQINDFLWFDDDQIFQWLGLIEEEEE